MEAVARAHLAEVTVAQARSSEGLAAGEATVGSAEQTLHIRLVAVLPRERKGVRPGTLIAEVAGVVATAAGLAGAAQEPEAEEERYREVSDRVSISVASVATVT